MAIRCFEPGRLHDALARDTGAFSAPSRYADTGVHHGYSTAPAGAGWGWVADEFAPVRSVIVSKLLPGGFLVPHCDAGPWFERWHVPIVPAGWMDLDGQPARAIAGRAFRIEHWRPHAVWNDGQAPRIHLVIDRDAPIDLPAAPIRTYPPPPPIRQLIDALEAHT